MYLTSSEPPPLSSRLDGHQSVAPCWRRREDRLQAGQEKKAVFERRSTTPDVIKPGASSWGGWLRSSRFSSVCSQRLGSKHTHSGALLAMSVFIRSVCVCKPRGCLFMMGFYRTRSRHTHTQTFDCLKEPPLLL